MLRCASAQVRGQGRVAGKVTDEQGQPLQDVVIKATMTGQTQVIQTKSNKKGEFTVGGIAGGEWNLEFSKDGFEAQSGKINVNEEGGAPDVTVKLAKRAEAAPDPGAELNAKAQEGLALLQQQKYPEARKIFEDLLAKFPDVHQLNAYIAQSYAGENNIAKAVELHEDRLRKGSGERRAEARARRPDDGEGRQGGGARDHEEHRPRAGQESAAARSTDRSR